MTHSSLVAVMEAHGDDAEAALSALANTDPAYWSAYVDGAAERRYRADLARHRRSRMISVARERIKAATGQVRLFEVTDAPQTLEVREQLRYDGDTYALADLAGAEGAAIMRAVAARDLAPAQTTLDRCKVLFALAEHVTAESQRLERDVTVAEVVGWVAAVAS